jgi:single-stranded-DNA-specific exonuclease
MTLLSDETLMKGIAFYQGPEADKGYSDVDILYHPVLNEFRGKISVEAQVTALRPSNK